MADREPIRDTSIVPVTINGELQFALQWGDQPPSPLAYDLLPVAIADAERMGCRPISVTPEAIEAHGKDPYLGQFPYEDLLPYARADIRQKAIKYGWSDHSEGKRYSS